MPERTVLSASWFSALTLNTAVGAILLLVNFPKLLTRIIDANIEDPGTRDALHVPILALHTVLLGLIGNNPIAFFGRAMACSFFILGLYLILLVLFSLRRSGFRMLFYGIGGILAGYLAFHMIAWAAVVLYEAVSIVFLLLGSIGHFIALVVRFVADYLWPLFAIAGAIGGAYLLYAARDAIFGFLRLLAGFLLHNLLYILGGLGLLWILGFAGIYLYRWVIGPVIRFLTLLLTPLVQFLGFLFKWLLIIVLILGGILIAAGIFISSLALIGSLFVTQLQAGWHAARGPGHLLVAGFAIGSSLALIILVSFATPAVADSLNGAWVAAIELTGMTIHAHSSFVTDTFRETLPALVERFASAHLTNSQAPAFDSLVFLAVIAVSCLSVLFRTLSSTPLGDEHVPVTFIAKEYALMSFGILFALLWIFAQSESGDSSG